MTFISPKTGDSPKKLTWNPAGTVYMTVRFYSMDVAPLVTVFIEPLGLSLYGKTGKIGDADKSDDIILLEPIEEALQTLPPSLRILDLQCFPSEKNNKPFDYGVVFYSKNGALEPTEYKFHYEGDQAGDAILIPVRLLP